MVRKADATGSVSSGTQVPEGEARPKRRKAAGKEGSSAPPQQRPTEEVAGKAATDASADAPSPTLFERFGHAAGKTVARIGATVEQVVDDPLKAGQGVVDAARRNPGKTAAVIGVGLVGVGTAVTTAVVGGVVAAGAGAVRTAQHVSDGKSIKEAVAATRDEAAQLTGQAADLKDQITAQATELGGAAVAEARKAITALAGWWNKGGGDKA